MPFKVVTTIEYHECHGKSDAGSTFKVQLEGGTTVIGTGGGSADPDHSFAIHPDFLPTKVKDLVDAEKERLFRIILLVVNVFNNTSCNLEDVARDLAERRDLTAYLSGVVVGEDLVATVGTKTLNLGRVVALEGSA